MGSVKKTCTMKRKAAPKIGTVYFLVNHTKENYWVLLLVERHNFLGGSAPDSFTCKVLMYTDPSYEDVITVGLYVDGSYHHRCLDVTP